LFSLLLVASASWVPLGPAAPSLAPSSPPDGTCEGVTVPAGTDLAAAMASHAPGTTYCVAAGTFRVTSPIQTDPSDRVIGAGRDATHIDGTALPQTAYGIFLTNSGNYFADLDIYGAPTPAAGSGTFCDPRSNCGKAFSIRGSSLTLRSVDCHDNGGNCIGGGGSNDVTVDSLECWNNGNVYSMTPDFRFAACIKRVAAYEPGNDTTVTNSSIHDNAWVGVWCDFCKYGLFDIEGNRIVNNGSSGIQWEMSGGWTADDRAIVRDNVIRGNNTLGNPVGGGVAISTANDILVESNTFSGNGAHGVSILFAPSRNPPQPDSRGVVVRNNTMRGDVIAGCDAGGPLKRLFLARSRIEVALLLLLMLLAAPIVAWRVCGFRPGLVVVSGAIGIVIALGLVLPAILSGPMCANNL
jgi:Right handed beta helix region